MNSKPAYLVADRVHPAWRSPLARALENAPSGIRDVSSRAEDGPLGVAAGVAGIEVEAQFARTLLARLTELEPPGVGPVARVRASVTVESETCYRIWFPQEYGDYVAAVVIDAWHGLT